MKSFWLGVLASLTAWLLSFPLQAAYRAARRRVSVKSAVRAIQWVCAAIPVTLAVCKQRAAMVLSGTPAISRKLLLSSEVMAILIGLLVAASLQRGVVTAVGAVEISKAGSDWEWTIANLGPTDIALYEISLQGGTRVATAPDSEYLLADSQCFVLSQDPRTQLPVTVKAGQQVRLELRRGNVCPLAEVARMPDCKDIPFYTRHEVIRWGINRGSIEHFTTGWSASTGASYRCPQSLHVEAAFSTIARDCREIASDGNGTPASIFNDVRSWCT